MTLMFEDFTPGPFGSFGPYHVSREEMIAFATEFDPQPMHLDDEAAKHSLLQGLAGSGWHLCAITMRMACDGFLLRTACLGSPGVDEVEWLSPLRPGDDLMMDVEVTGSRVSSKPERGFVNMKYTIRNARGETLMRSARVLIVRRRDAVAATGAVQ